MSTPTQASKDFAFEEFAVSVSHKGMVRPVPPTLRPRIERLAKFGLQPVRDRLKRPMQILSGYRPSDLNSAVGGSPTSQHVVGEAADFTCEDVLGAFKEIIAMVRDGELRAIGQIIFYPDKNFIHMALVSSRFETATCCVHWPEKGIKYRVVSPSVPVLENLLTQTRSA